MCDHVSCVCHINCYIWWRSADVVENKAQDQQNWFFIQIVWVEWNIQDQKWKNTVKIYTSEEAHHRQNVDSLIQDEDLNYNK